MVNSAFEGSVGGCCRCGGWVPSGFGADCFGRDGRAGVFPFVFVLYLNDLLFETSSSALSISSL